MSHTNHHTQATIDLFETIARAFRPKPKHSRFVLGGEIYSNEGETEDEDNYPDEDLDGRDGE